MYHLYRYHNYQMAQIISKRNNLLIPLVDNLQPQSVSQKEPITPNTANQKVLFLVFMEQNNIAVVHSTSIVIMNTKTNEVQQRIKLSFEVCKIQYSPKFQQFVILPKCLELTSCQMVTVSRKNPSILNSFYKYKENNTAQKEFQWQSWLKFFNESERVVLIRKFYGYSLCCVFQQNPDLVKLNEFRINEQCISKLDQDKYMVNFRQVITRYALIVEIVNVQTNVKSQYKISEQIVPNTTKSIKLWKKSKQNYGSKGQQVALTLLIAMNTKFQGYSLMIVNVLEESNLYNILGVISQPKYQIYKLFTPQVGSQEILTLQYRYDEENRKNELVLCNYQINETANLFNETSNKTIQSSFIGSTFNYQTRQIAFFENIFEFGTKMEISTHRLNLEVYKKVEKEAAYAYFLSHMGCSKSIAQQVLNLLA